MKRLEEWGSGGIVSRILILGTSWKLSGQLQPPFYALDRLGGPRTLKQSSVELEWLCKEAAVTYCKMIS
jgi:hypothetical protein